MSDAWSNEKRKKASELVGNKLVRLLTQCGNGGKIFGFPDSIGLMESVYKPRRVRMCSVVFACHAVKTSAANLAT